MIKGVLLTLLLGLMGAFSPARAQFYNPLSSTICYANPTNAEPCYAEASGYTGYVEVELDGACYYECGGEGFGYPVADTWGFWACAYVQPDGVVIGFSGTY